MTAPHVDVMVYVHYRHQGRRRLDSYAGDDRFGGFGFPVLRATRFFVEDHGPHTFSLVGRGQEGFAHAIHLLATPTLKLNGGPPWPSTSQP